LSQTDLRDTGGNKLNIVEVIDFGKKYVTGGIEIEPNEFGLSSIQHIDINLSAVAEIDGSYQLVSKTLVTKVFDAATGKEKWKLTIFLAGVNGFVELANGSNLQFPENMRPTFTIIGS
jgi:hypothetical protein